MEEEERRGVFEENSRFTQRRYHPSEQRIKGEPYEDGPCSSTESYSLDLAPGGQFIAREQSPPVLCATRLPDLSIIPYGSNANVRERERETVIFSSPGSNERAYEVTRISLNRGGKRGKGKRKRDMHTQTDTHTHTQKER